MIKKYIFLSIISLALFSSCNDKEEELGPLVNLGAVPVITSPTGGTAFVMDENNADASVTTFEWTAADFGYQAGITYTLSFDSEGNDFAEAITLGSANALSFSDLSIGKLNNILLAKGLPDGFANPLEIRVCAKVSDLVEELCSDAVAITVEPYKAEVVFPFLTVPGDYQGWDPANVNTAVYSRKSDDIYEGYIYFPVETAVYKFAQNLSWDTNWGDVEPDGVLDAGGIDNNIPINEGIGMYRITCDLNTLTHANQLTSWGVIGDATAGGWDTDTDMVWDEDKALLTLTTDLSMGELKFRANDDWAINFGDDFANGSLEADGANIAVPEAGNYTINLILTQSEYTFELIKN